MVDNNIQENKESLVVILNSYLLAFILAGNFIAFVFEALGLVEEGLYPIIVTLSVSIAITSSIIFMNEPLRVHKYTTLFLGIIIMVFLVSYLRFYNFTYLNEYFLDFIFYGFVMYIMTLLPISYKKTVEAISLLSLLTLLNPVVIINEFISERSKEMGDLQIEMGLAYGILPVVTAGILHFTFYKEKSNIFNKLSYIVSFILLILLMIYSVRGVFIALVVLFYAIIYSLIGGKFEKVLKGLLHTTLIVGIIILINIEKIIENTFIYLTSKSIEITAVTKSYEKMLSDVGLSNGRQEIYEDAINVAIESPMLGHGIAYYANLTSGEFPHNLFIQLAIESGLILTIPILIILISVIKIVFGSIKKNNGNYDYKVLLMLLFISSVPRLMISSYLWKEQYFWLLLFLFLANLQKKRKE